MNLGVLRQDKFERLYLLVDELISWENQSGGDFSIDINQLLGRGVSAIINSFTYRHIISMCHTVTLNQEIEKYKFVHVIKPF